MLKFFSLLLISCLCVINSYAIITITDSSTSTIIGDQLFVLKSNKASNIQQVSQSSNFIPLSKKIPNLGIQPNSVWLKFTVCNQSKKNHLLLKIDYPILDSVDLFISKGNHFICEHSGELVPFKDREVLKSPFILFDLYLSSGETKTYYLKIKSIEQIIVPISIVTPKVLWQNTFKETLIIGFFVGIIAIMILYNFFLYVSVRDKNYLYYILYILFSCLTQTGILGCNYLFFWPNRPGLELVSLQLFACLGGIFALVFSYYFLQVRGFKTILNKLYLILIINFCISFILFLFAPQLGFIIMQINTGCIAFLILGTAIYVVIKKKNYPPAKIFLIAWGILIGSSLVFQLKDFNILPYNGFTRFSFIGGNVIEVALLAFALAFRINLLKKERELSHLAALRLANENERIIKEQNVTLERKVSLRTEELNKKNVALNQAYDDLKKAQVQLVASEKMSSLGQLTAGIAHEINNPINFVSANISPLRRDGKILFEMIEKMESIGSNTKIPAAQRLKEMEELKKQEDLDFLKEEIKLLIHGIQDGATRTANIVKGLRVFSRLDEDAWKSADINEGLNATLKLSENMMKGIQLTTTFGDVPLITCFPGKLNQVFLNVITNAVYAIRKKHGHQKGGLLQVSTYQENDWVCVSIKDDGTGMDESTKDKLFEPFFTTKPVGEGTGLGMSISFTILKQHSAQCIVHSEKGKGTEFIMRFHIHPPEILEQNNDGLERNDDNIV